VIASESEKEDIQKGVAELQSKIDALQDEVDKQALKNTQIANLTSTASNLQKVDSVAHRPE
jgi:hypothetical protein